MAFLKSHILDYLSEIMNKLKHLLKDIGFTSNKDETNWVCYLPEKSYIIKFINNHYNVIKVKHNFDDDGSFCSSISVGNKTLSEDELIEWLLKKKNKACN